MQHRTISGHAEINAARTLLANYAIDRDALVTLWVDADNAPSTETCLHLMKMAYEQPGIHSATYVKKSSQLITSGDQVSKVVNFKPFKNCKTVALGNKIGGPVKVKSVGFGAVAISINVYRALVKMVPEVYMGDGLTVRHYFMPEVVHDRYLHDDEVFCMRARRAGFNVVVWTNHLMGHDKGMTLVPPSGVFNIGSETSTLFPA